MVTIVLVGWDDSRPVPWRRLFKEWLIYAAIMAVVFTVFFRDDGNVLAILGGLLVSGPLYLGLGYVLAKFGYTRKTLGERSTPRAASTGPSSPGGDSPVDRPRPAPTRRTSSGPNRPARSKRR